MASNEEQSKASKGGAPFNEEGGRGRGRRGGRGRGRRSGGRGDHNDRRDGDENRGDNRDNGHEDQKGERRDSRGDSRHNSRGGDDRRNSRGGRGRRQGRGRGGRGRTADRDRGDGPSAAAPNQDGDGGGGGDGEARSLKAKAAAGGPPRSERVSGRVIFVGNVKAMEVEEFDAVVGEAFRSQGFSFEESNYQAGSTFCFLTFKDEEEAGRVMDQMHLAKVGGSRILVESVPEVTPGIDPRTVSHIPLGDANRTLVVKNLPFSMREEDLAALLSSAGVNAEGGVALHYDQRDHTFRGMAFVKLRHVAAAVEAFSLLTGREVQGRRIKVEFKRKPQGRADYEPPDEVSADLFEEVAAYSKGTEQGDLHMPKELSGFYRKQLHMIAEKLRLAHWSEGEGDERHIIISKEAKERQRAERKKAAEQAQASSQANWRSPSPADAVPASARRESVGKERPRFSAPLGSSPPKTGTFAAVQPDAQVIAPRRQPKGPDGTRGFRASSAKEAPKEEGAGGDEGAAEQQREV